MELLDELIGLDRSINALEARRSAVLARLADNPDPDDREWISVDVARALTIADATASWWLHEASALMDLPRVFTAAAAGDLPRTKTSILASGARRMVERAAGERRAELLERFEQAVLPHAIVDTPGELRRRVKKVVGRLAPLTLVGAETDAEATRGVSVWTDEAQAFVQFRLTADGAEVVMTAIDAHSGKHENDDRTIDQRRADALVDICNHALNGHGSGLQRSDSWQGRRPAVNLTVSLSALLGADGPGELAGLGPVSADLARELAFDPTASWTMCVVDAGGRLVHRSAKTYRPPAAMREYVLTRDGVCSMPGCLRSARRCELDHIVDWMLSHDTSADNLQPLCPRHHHAKHDAGWEPERQPDGSMAWLSPSGRVYRKPVTTLPSDPVIGDLDPPPF